MTDPAPPAEAPAEQKVTVRRVGHESAAIVLAIIQDAFGGRPPLDPPADALSDTLSSVATRLALNGGLVARVAGEPVGTLIFDPVGDDVYIRRFGVVGAAQGHGVAAAMIRAASEAWTGRGARLTVVAREELPRTVAFWQRRGFAQVDRRRPYVELTRQLPRIHAVATADDMRALGRRIARAVRPGDVLVLSGDLGAGKTTFTQGLGEGLGVQGAITSPTFVISRVHTGRGEGPDLVHVDAYRLGGIEELDDLDLDTSLDDAVTVVEWGEGLAEALAPSRLEIQIRHAEPDARATGPGPGPDPDADLEEPVEPRVVEILAVGPRWATV